MGGRRVSPSAFSMDQPLQRAARHSLIQLGRADGDAQAGLGSGESEVNKTDMVFALVEVHGLVARQTPRHEVSEGKRQAGLGGRVTSSYFYP